VAVAQLWIVRPHCAHMEKNRKSRVIIGFVLNLIFGIFMVLFAVRHPHWDTLSLTPDARFEENVKSGTLQLTQDKMFEFIRSSRAVAQSERNITDAMGYVLFSIVLISALGILWQIYAVHKFKKRLERIEP
jgi:hypothetical protein